MAGSRYGWGGDTVAVVEHLDGDGVPVTAKVHLGPRPRSGVLEHVGQGLLDDAVHRQLHSNRQGGPETVHRDRDVEAGGAHLLDESGEVREAGLGAQAVGVGLRSEHTEQVAQLVQRLASRLLHRTHRRSRAFRVLVRNCLGRLPVRS
jgi:hypothetical protein